jgi:hypothetical protein
MEEFFMEQLSLFELLTESEKRDGTIFPSEIQDELILLMSHAILEVYTKEKDCNETDKET